MITIVDLQIGNTGSVARALKFLKCKYVVTDKVADIETAEKIIFPGVGSFAEASRKLESSQLGNAIRQQVIQKKTPIFGICLGMQLLAKEGHEGGVHPGLGLVEARVMQMNSKDIGLRLPHMGWNNLSSNDLRLLKDISQDACFYFVHSYEMKLEEKIKNVTTDYGTEVIAMVEKGHIFGAQFHPEKSQDQGLKILKNFIEI